MYNGNVLLEWMWRECEEKDEKHGIEETQSSTRPSRKRTSSEADNRGGSKQPQSSESGLTAVEDVQEPEDILLSYSYPTLYWLAVYRGCLSPALGPIWARRIS